MRFKRLSLLVCLIFITTNIGAFAGQIPSQFSLLMAWGDPLPYHFDLVGSSTEGGLTAEWTVTDFSAEVRITGTHNESGVPHFCLTWTDTGDVLPLSVTFTTNAAGPYSYEPFHWPVGGTAYDHSLSLYNLTTNAYFGHYFPEAESFLFMVSFYHVAVDYDLTVSLDWGAGVPAEPTSWGQIKSIYR